MLDGFKTCDPREFIIETGYTARIGRDSGKKALSIKMLDGSNEIFMDVILVAIMDLFSEGKTISEVRYKGKGVKRWFQMVYPAAMAPMFFGIFTEDDTWVGYLVVNQSILSAVRKGLGIALLRSWRGQGIGFSVIKHVQDNLPAMFNDTINELYLETSRTNGAMLGIARRLGFAKISFPSDDSWAKPDVERVRFLWKKT